MINESNINMARLIHWKNIHEKNMKKIWLVDNDNVDRLAVSVNARFSYVVELHYGQGTEFSMPYCNYRLC